MQRRDSSGNKRKEQSRYIETETATADRDNGVLRAPAGKISIVTVEESGSMPVPGLDTETVITI